MRYIKCVDCDHKYCEFCNAGDKYQKKAKSNAVTNFDRIKAMSAEELAKLLCYCSDCGSGRCYGDKLCTYGDGACNGLVKWLESEVQEDE